MFALCESDLKYIKMWRNNVMMMMMMKRENAVVSQFSKPFVNSFLHNFPTLNFCSFSRQHRLYTLTQLRARCICIVLFISFFPNYSKRKQTTTKFEKAHACHRKIISKAWHTRLVVTFAERTSTREFPVCR